MAEIVLRVNIAQKWSRRCHYVSVISSKFLLEYTGWPTSQITLEVIHHPNFQLLPIIGVELDPPCMSSLTTNILEGPEVCSSPDIIRLFTLGLNQHTFIIVPIPITIGAVVSSILLTYPTTATFNVP